MLKVWPRISAEDARKNTNKVSSTESWCLMSRHHSEPCWAPKSSNSCCCSGLTQGSYCEIHLLCFSTGLLPFQDKHAKNYLTYKFNACKISVIEPTFGGKYIDTDLRIYNPASFTPYFHWQISLLTWHVDQFILDRILDAANSANGRYDWTLTNYM